MSQGQEKFVQMGLWWRDGTLNGASGIAGGAGLLFCGVLGQERWMGGSEKSRPSTSAAAVSDSSEATPARIDDHDNLFN